MSAEFSIDRTAVIHAPVSELFARLADLRTWRDWASWEQVEPEMYREYSGAERGVGARYAWSGVHAGAGSVEIVDAAAGHPAVGDSGVGDPGVGGADAGDVRLVMDLRVVVPFRARWTTTLILAPHGADATEVRWTVAGRRGPVMRLRVRRAGTDATIAGHLERGLAGLARVATSGRAPERR